MSVSVANDNFDFSQRIQLVDYDKRADRCLLYGPGKKKFYSLNISTGEKHTFDAAEFAEYQDARLCGDYIFVITGETPKTVRLTQLSLVTGETEMVTLDDQRRNPVFRFPSGETCQLWWYRQDPIAEKRGGWVPVKFRPLLPVSGKFVSLQKGIQNVDSAEYFTRLAWADKAFAEHSQIDHFDGTDFSMSLPCVRETQNQVFYLRGGYEMETKLRVWSSEMQEAKTVVGIPGHFDDLGPRWMAQQDLLVLPMINYDNRQMFRVYDCKKNELLSLLIEGHAYGTPFFVTKNNTLLYQTSPKRITTSRMR